MAFPNNFPILASFFLLFFSSLPNSSLATTRKLGLFQLPGIKLNYHNGPLLKGDIRVDIIWYGSFTSKEHSIVANFIRSFTATNPPPSVASWWQTTANYKGSPSNIGPPNIILGKQTVDANCSLGKSLTESHLLSLASQGSHRNRIKVVLTAADVTFDQFCMICGSHGVGYGNPQLKKGKFAYAWVGNPASQCPGQCAWPFFAPQFGPPQTVTSPNGNGAIDGMMISLATVLANAVTNPYGNGYYQGPKGGPEAVSACAGLYGQGSSQGNLGMLKVDQATKASYNVEGVNGYKFLVPSIWNPVTSACFTV